MEGIFSGYFFRNYNVGFLEKRKMYCCYTHMRVARFLHFLTTVLPPPLPVPWKTNKFHPEKILQMHLFQTLCVCLKIKSIAKTAFDLSTVQVDQNENLLSSSYLFIV